MKRLLPLLFCLSLPSACRTGSSASEIAGTRAPSLDDCRAAKALVAKKYKALSNGIGLGRGRSGACVVVMNFQDQEHLDAYMEAAGSSYRFVTVNGVKVEVTTKLIGTIETQPGTTVGN